MIGDSRFITTYKGRAYYNWKEFRAMTGSVFEGQSSV
jgi:hypothetical protein